MSGTEDVLKKMTELVKTLTMTYESSPSRLTQSEELIKMADEAQSIPFLGYGHFHRAIFYFSSQVEYDKFKGEMELALAYLKGTEHNIVLSSAYMLLGTDALNYGQTNLGLDYFLLSKYYADLSDINEIKSVADFYMSGFYITIGEYDRALHYAKISYDEALHPSEYRYSFFESDGIDMAVCMLGQCYIWMGQFDEAWKCYEISKERQKGYTPRYDCPNTALINAFHIMVLHATRNYELRDEACDAMLDILHKHKPAPPVFMHILNVTSFLIRSNQYDYAKRFMPYLISSNAAIQNPNFSVLIQNMKIAIAKHDNDEKAYFKALEEHYQAILKSFDYINKNTRTSVQVRLEMQQISDEAAKAKNELEIARRSNEAKSTFLSNVSHEIRTPLNAILGMDEIIMRETTDDDIYGYAADIQSAGNTLLSLINDILDSSKLEAGKLSIIPVEYDITSVINDLTNMIKSRAENKGLEFFVEVEKNVPFLLYGDEIRIKQCALNILTNALKYTEEGSIHFRISSREATSEEVAALENMSFSNVDGTKAKLGDNAGSLNGACPIVIRFSVEDTGSGIKEEDIEKLFSRFDRIEEEKNRNIEGTGLGMSIVQGLLGLMNSHLEVQSTYGKGSVFSFEVVQGARSCELLGDYTKHLENINKEKEQYRVSHIAPDAKILVVDDTVANLTVLKGLLKPTKIKIDTCTSGKDAIALVKTNRYDILFIDQRMPVMDGVETLHAIKGLKQNASKDAVCIALTANAISGAREWFLNAGFDDYLTKPVNSKKLERMVFEYLDDALIQHPSVVLDEKKPPEQKKRNAYMELDEKLLPLRAVPGIDIPFALLNCGERSDVLIEAIQNYCEAYSDNAKHINDYYEEKDWENYTILVHGLKSSSRLIGAMSLSNLAANMEEAGDCKDVISIRKHTPELLKKYKTIVSDLKDAFGLVPDADYSDDSKEMISDKMFTEILEAIKEFTAAFDFDTALESVKTLKDYSIPKEKQELVKNLHKALMSADREGIFSLLE